MKKVLFAPLVDVDVPYSCACSTDACEFPEHGWQTLDVYVPQGTDRLHPVVMLVHGGSYAGLKSMEKSVAKSLAREAASIVIVPNDYGCDDAQSVRDASLALRWLHKNVGWYGGDCDDVTAYGVGKGIATVETMRLIDSAAQRCIKRIFYQNGCGPEEIVDSFIRQVVAR